VASSLTAFKKTSIEQPVFPLRKFDTEQMFVLVRMQLRKHVDAQPVKRFKRYKGYTILN